MIPAQRAWTDRQNAANVRRDAAVAVRKREVAAAAVAVRKREAGAAVVAARKIIMIMATAAAWREKVTAPA